ncbi:MAG: ferric iron uptake transcriptional regulator [Pseudomonadota bacterium]
MDRNDIKKAGLKVTMPRMEILALLERSPHRHLSAEEIYHLLDAARSDLGLPTVYRVLNQLESAGLVTRRQFARGGAVFELRRDPHHCHILCVNCGRIEEFNDADIETRLRAVADRLRYELSEYSLVVYGRCSSGGCSVTSSTI